MFYEYECAIHNIFEVEQKIIDEPLMYCPKCKEDNIETPVKKLISLTSFALKGGGWADSGYGNK